MALELDDIRDHLTATLPRLKKHDVSQMAQSITSFEFSDHIMRDNAKVVSGGKSININAWFDGVDSARHVGLYEDDEYNFEDTLEKGNIPWRYSNTYWGIDEREVAANSSGEQIVDLYKQKRAAAQLSMIELTETWGWSKPTDSTDKKTPFGLTYWLTKNSSKGFNGGNPTGFSAGRAGLSTTDFPNWANYTDQYVNMTSTDLIDSMKEAKLRTGFKTPIGLKDFREGTGYKCRYYVNKDTYLGLKSIGEAQNENLGHDLDSQDGMTRFGGCPIVYTPKLDSDSTDPVYQIDWTSFTLYVMKNFFMKEKKPRIVPQKHNVIVVDVDTMWNLGCDNLRKNAVISK